MTDQEYPIRRTATRAPLDKPARLQVDEATDVLAGRCLNISIGGFFVALAPPRPPGTLTRFELVIDEEVSIRGLGEVAWMRSTALSPDQPIGMGVKFRHLDQSDRQQIFKLVSQHIKDRLANRRQLGSPSERLPIPEAASSEPASSPSRAPKTPSSPVGAGPIKTLPSAVDAPLPLHPFGQAEPHPAEEPRHRAEDILRGEPLPDPRSEPAEAPRLDLELELDPVEPELPLRGTGREETRDEASPSAMLSWSEEEPDDGLLYDQEDDEDDLDGRDVSTRPAPRRDFPWLPVLALLLLILVAVLFVFRDEILGGPAHDSESSSQTSRASLPAPTEAGAGEGGRDLSGTELRQEKLTGNTHGESELSAAAEDDTSAGAREPPQSAPSISAVPIDAAPESPTLSKPAEPRPIPFFTRILDISWTALPQGLKVVIVADGQIPPARFKHSRLDDGSPREVVRFFNVREKFDRKILEVGGPEVSRIRTGFHRNPRGSELHVVIDLMEARYRVTDISNRGSRLEIEIKPS